MLGIKEIRPVKEVPDVALNVCRHIAPLHGGNEYQWGLFY